MDIKEETGWTAGRIYEAIAEKGGSATLTQIKKKVKSDVFDYAIGWLMREHKVVIEAKGKTKKLTLI